MLDVSDESLSLIVHNLTIVQQMSQALFEWCNTCHLKHNILVGRFQWKLFLWKQSQELGFLLLTGRFQRPSWLLWNIFTSLGSEGWQTEGMKCFQVQEMQPTSSLWLHLQVLLVIESAALLFESSSCSWSSPLTFAILSEGINMYQLVGLEVKLRFSPQEMTFCSPYITLSCFSRKGTQTSKLTAVATSTLNLLPSVQGGI